MASIFAAPETIKIPPFNFRDLVASRKAEESYVQEVKDYCLKTTRNNGDAYVGKMLQIPHADGRAATWYILQDPSS